ncbi:Receptor-like protein kinase ANXUR2 [Capsicum annuum]|uniref:receptor-like protein kinase ANXUR1 n=1 Tax=Capsicum annuum TaxID=4072 RepID=UPI0007BF9FA2|nr:receptor-like protein kinase ANXUR1 [Capsicum annuum]KAF3622153.1 Receptor-like protein kinase ANXUR2 [Capsicum annuum]KAF3654718.1 Receptor-like protein kinase ANXUR2 [Capsicum annuum]
MLTKSSSHILLLFLCSISCISRSLHAANNDQNALFLACGSENGGTDEDARKWEPDAKYLKSGDKSVMTQPGSNDPLAPSVVPYTNARIFQSESSYDLPVKNQTAHVMLRLHFNPTAYPNFNVSDSYITVSAGKVTLLNNFSAYITAQALSQSYIIKEYLLDHVDSSTVEIKIKPFGKSSFAFINGIEMITLPDIFFGPDPLIVGFMSGSSAGAQQSVSVKDNNMELMYRVNVGGQYISPKNDSGGLMRRWYEDTPYLYGASTGVTMRSNRTVSYDGMPSYVAPLSVYESCRSMGFDSNVNKNYNLTWVFNVDSNFTYLVRFHWCDFTIDATRINSMVFTVYISGQIADMEVDLVAMKNRKKAVAIEKDYVTRVDGKEGQLWVAVHPSGANSEIANAIVNGIEIFKIGGGTTSLAGPNPTMSDLMKKHQEEQSKEDPGKFAEKEKTKTNYVAITGAVGGVAAFSVAAVLALVVYKRKKRTAGVESRTNSWLPIHGNSHSSGSKSGGSTTISSDAASNCRYFSLAEIKQATKNFHESYVIGVGGFGKVYRGVIDGDQKVAIKRSNPSSEQGVNEFQTEIEMLSKLRHRHLVSLIGFCEENNEMVLVYDHMAHGTLREHLYKGNKITLTWKQRLDICIGAARGLHYLHTGSKYTIIHRDVKSTNILLNDQWVAKVSDFGLSKTGPNMNQGHVTTVVKGSFGYLDPEYFRRQQLTEKSDVYSFGVVLFEVLCARPALNANLPKEQVSLADWALVCQRKGNLEDIIDPQLKGKINPECLKKFAETAEKCLADNGIDRPSMGDVLWNLEYALQLEENPDGVLATSESTKEVDHGSAEEVSQHNLIAMHRSTLSLESDKGDNNTDDVFSQIVNPTGR